MRKINESQKDLKIHKSQKNLIKMPKSFNLAYISDFNLLSANVGYIYAMTPWSLRTAVTLDTVKIMKNF